MTHPNVQWLMAEGYSIENNHIDKEHRLVKDGITLRIDGRWDHLLNGLSDGVMRDMIPLMHYATGLKPIARFDLTYIQGWKNECITIEREWLRQKSKHLLQRVLEFGLTPPMRHTTEAPGAIKCAGSDAGLFYFVELIDTKLELNKPVLQITTWYTNYADPEPIAHLSPAAIAKFVGIPSGIETLLGEPFSREWWTSIRDYYVAKPLESTPYENLGDLSPHSL